MECLPIQVPLTVGDSIVALPTYIDTKSNHLCLQLIAQEEMLDDLQKFCQESAAVKLTQQNVVSNALCLGKYSADDQWYRGIIKEVNSGTNMAKVLFLDYGNIGNVSIQDGLMEISDFLLGFVPLTYNCVWPKGTSVKMQELKALQEDEMEMDVKILSSDFDRTSQTMLYTISIPELEEEKRAVDKNAGAGGRDQVDRTDICGTSSNVGVVQDQDAAVADIPIPTDLATTGPRVEGQVDIANNGGTSSNVGVVQDAAVADIPTDLATTGPRDEGQVGTSNNGIGVVQVQDAAVADMSSDLPTPRPRDENAIVQAIMDELDNNQEMRNMLRRCFSEIVTIACRKAGNPN